MKVTICFDEVKVIVPCAKLASETESRLTVTDVIESAIARYKKATGKVSYFYYYYY